jgi:hypothetical protein
VGDDVHRAVERTQALRERVNDFFERGLRRRIAEARRRKSRDRKALAKQEGFEPVEPKAVDDDDRSALGGQWVP